MALGDATVARPAIPNFSFAQLVTLSGIAVAAPTLPTLAIAQSGTVFFGGVVVARPALPALKIDVEQLLDLRGATVGAPAFPPLAMIQAQVLALLPFATGPPTFPLYIVSEEVDLRGHDGRRANLRPLRCHGAHARARGALRRLAIAREGRRSAKPRRLEGQTKHL